MEKNATHKQKQITDFFNKTNTSSDDNNDSNASIAEPCDIEDIAGRKDSFKVPIASVTKRKRRNSEEEEDNIKNKSWKEILGSPPPRGTTKVYSYN